MRNKLQCGTRVLDLDSPCAHVMGVLNITPDSFSDAGRFYQNREPAFEMAFRQACEMVEQGAVILDVGGESTRPGAAPVSLQQELDRVLPMVERIGRELDVIVSVDTSRPEVMLEAAGLGAGMINDVRALGMEGALRAAAATGLSVCLMHMQGSPATMQVEPSYDNVVAEVCDFLSQQTERCVQAGIGREKIVLDPGFGFGKSLHHNLYLLQQLQKLVALGYPVLAGLSRKSMLGGITGKSVDQRLASSVAAALLAAQAGAVIIRVHDVAETVDALKVLQAVRDVEEESV
ncbi:dihydropteroate synthase [Nitrincola alkalilacustris]|uniref:dihydropteroate synthase n=1 Tax=Nitrincola alkalilacustris TaxID=1571224 RepID=UPI0030B84D8E